jgi:hypothetical protein
LQKICKKKMKRDEKIEDAFLCRRFMYKMLEIIFL